MHFVYYTFWTTLNFINTQLLFQVFQIFLNYHIAEKKDLVYHKNILAYIVLFYLELRSYLWKRNFIYFWKFKTRLLLKAMPKS